LDSDDWSGISGNVLVDLYIRLRDEADADRYTADPNDGRRASIAMAIFEASQSRARDLAAVETRVRRKITLPSQPIKQVSEPAGSTEIEITLAHIAGPRTSMLETVAGGGTGWSRTAMPGLDCTQNPAAT
jgi:hypothetical protein